MVGVTLSLFALSCLISQSAMDFFSTLLCLAMLYLGWTWKQQQNMNQRLWNPIGFDILFLVWFFAVALSFVINFDPDSRWLLRLVEFKWILIFYLMIAAFRYVQPTENILKWSCILASICGGYAVALWFLGFDPLRDIPELQGNWYDRTGGLFSDPMTFAHSYGQVFCWFFGLSLLALKWKSSWRPWLFVASGILGIAVFLSFTRGVWLGAFTAIFVMIFFVYRKMALAFVAFTIFLFVTLLAVWPAFRLRINQNMGPVEISNQLTGSDSERAILWRNHFQIFKDHPIWGVGYGENTRILPEYYKQNNVPENTLVSHAHNQYLHMMAGTGAVGAMLYILICGAFVWLNLRVLWNISSRDVFHRGLALGLLGSQVCFLVSGLTEANFEHSKVRFILMFTWSMVVWLAYEHRILRDRV